MKPSIGPIAGGTEVTIDGTDLNTGAEIVIFLDKNTCHAVRFVSIYPKCGLSLSKNYIWDGKINVIISHY